MMKKLDFRQIQKIQTNAVTFGSLFDLSLANALVHGDFADQEKIEQAFPDWISKFSRDKSDFWDERAGE